MQFFYSEPGDLGLLAAKFRKERSKSKEVQKLLYIKYNYSNGAQRQHSIVKSKEVKFHTPKALVPLKKETSYAAIPRRQKSKLLQFVIKKHVQEFRHISRKASSKKSKGTQAKLVQWIT